MEKPIKMSLETAKLMYKVSKDTQVDGNPTQLFLLENFTLEELEGKKGFSWEDSINGDGWYIHQSHGELMQVLNATKDTSLINLFKTKKQAESALAFAQLSHIVAKNNEGKVFSNTCYTVRLICNGELKVDHCILWKPELHLGFCTFEDAKTSLEVNKELWIKYWML